MKNLCGNNTNEEDGSMQRSVVMVLLPCLTAYFIWGCAFATGGLLQEVPVTTNVSGAKIMVDGQPYGNSPDGGAPLIVNLKRNKPHFVTASKDGYESSTRSLEKTLNSLGMLDAIGAAIWLLPIVTLITGQAWELEPESLYLPLDRMTPEKAP
jgi:hypothetical protein